MDAAVVSASTCTALAGEEVSAVGIISGNGNALTQEVVTFDGEGGAKYFVEDSTLV